MGDFPNPGIEPRSLVSPALAGRFFNTSTTWEVQATLYSWHISEEKKKKSLNEDFKIKVSIKSLLFKNQC